MTLHQKYKKKSLKISVVNTNHRIRQIDNFVITNYVLIVEHDQLIWYCERSNSRIDTHTIIVIQLIVKKIQYTKYSIHFINVYYFLIFLTCKKV